MQRFASPPALAAAAIAVLALCWLFTVPPGGGLDEKGHHVKALGVGGLDWRGEPQSISAAEREAFAEAGQAPPVPGSPDPDVVARILRFQERTTREFDVPDELFDQRFGCTAASPEQSAACLDEPAVEPSGDGVPSAFGTYQPYLYVLPGFLSRVPGAAEPSLLAARAGTLLVSVGLLAAAFLLLWLPRAGASSLLGPAVAITPMTVLLSGTLSTSGPEIAAAICLAAALIRLLRDPDAPCWAWAAAGAGALVLAAARPLGPAFVAVIVVALTMLNGPRSSLAALRRSSGSAALAAAAATGAGIAAGVAWQLGYQPSPDRSLSLGAALENAVERLPTLAEQAVGIMGGMDAPLPGPAHWLWGLLAAGLVLTAGRGTGRNGRLGLAVLCVGALCATVALAVVLEEQAGGQGRYILPLLVLVPLWAGDVLARGPLAARAGPWAAGAITIAAAVQLLAFVTGARRHAVGTDGSWNFVGSAEWSPPAGWWLWLLLAALAALALAASGGLAAAGHRRQDHQRVGVG